MICDKHLRKCTLRDVVLASRELRENDTRENDVNFQWSNLFADLTTSGSDINYETFTMTS